MLEENQEAADTPYRLLSDIFEGHEDKVLEIEILGSEVPLPQGHLILQDGLSIGLSKKALAKAFLEARSIFMKRDDGIDQDVRSFRLAVELSASSPLRFSIS